MQERADLAFYVYVPGKTPSTDLAHKHSIDCTQGSKGHTDLIHPCDLLLLEDDRTYKPSFMSLGEGKEVRESVVPGHPRAMPMYPAWLIVSARKPRHTHRTLN